MRRQIITYIFLLPLAILLCVPCSTKKDIKQLFDICNHTPTQIGNASNNTVCVYKPVKIVKHEKKEQNSKFKHTFGISLLSFLPSTTTTLHQSYNSDPKVSSPIPIFLIYRKLII